MTSAGQIAQLESARGLPLGDGRYYPTILPGVLPIIRADASPSPEVLRWGSDFLAETFASPTWPSDAKEGSSLSVLPVLKDYLDVDDAGVVKSAIQAAASIYPLVYRHIVSDPNDTQNWQLMLAIKSNILRRMDSAMPSLRICCVKFVQQVVLAQTPGMVADPRRPEHNDISLALVPRDHPLIPYANLEAEASGLLDRLLDMVHGDHSDALLVTANLNALGTLIQRRPIVANKILSSILNSNPLKLANSPMTPKNKVIMKSIERTTRALLVNVMKRNPENSFNGRIQQFLERMHRTRLDVFDETNRKRPAPSEPTDGLDATKRQRLGAEPHGSASSLADLPPGPVSFRQLYTLDPDPSIANFDVQVFQDQDTLLRILIPILQSIDGARLGNAINTIRSRYLALSTDASRAYVGASNGALTVSVDDEDEYEPDFEPEDAEQVVNKLDSAPPEGLYPEHIRDASLAPYKLPEAPPLTEQEVQKYGTMTVQRVCHMLGADTTSSKAKGTKGGFNRLAATNYDHDSWFTILARLGTRAAFGLDDPDVEIKSEHTDMMRRSFSLSDSIRNRLYDHIIQEWKIRLDIATSWLHEEWYNDRLQIQTARKAAKAAWNGNASSIPDPKGNYEKWALKLLDGILPYIEGSDKILVRFMSEIPEINKEFLHRMKKIAEDPERIDLSIMVLQYLYMFRPPVREMCVDVLEEMWLTNDRAKPSARKLLSKWRPQALENENDIKPNTANGALEVKPVS